MLKARLADINKLVQGHALDIVARIATGMNRPFEKYSRILVLPVAQVMADQKANIRASACTTLTAVANASEGIDSMAHFIGTALESTNPLLRTTLLGWIAGWLKANHFSSSTDISNWVPSLVSCLEDRSADVRKGATSILPIVIAHVGVDYVIEKANALKPASRSAVMPLIQAAKAAAPPRPASTLTPAAPPPPTTAPKSTTPVSEEATAPAAAPSRKGLLSRRLGAASPRPASRAENEPEPPSPGGSLGMIKKGHALKRPLSVSAKPPTPVLSSSDSLPFITASPDPKRGRLAKDGSRWVIESGPSRKDLFEALQHQMETHASQELLSLLFSHDHNAVNDHIAGLTMICDCYTSTAAGEESFGVSIEEAKAILIANADLPLKYVSTKIHEPQPNLMNKCLDVLDSVLALLTSAAYLLSDAEASCFVPTMIHKVRIRFCG
jgi:cytoskeleton-associated protein 5